MADTLSCVIADSLQADRESPKADKVNDNEHVIDRTVLLNIEDDIGNNPSKEDIKTPDV